MNFCIIMTIYYYYLLQIHDYKSNADTKRPTGDAICG